MDESLSLNQYNILADKNTYGKWKDVNGEYFSDPKTIEALYRLFAESNVLLPHHIELVDFGSAEGLVGEYFKQELSKKHSVNLTLVDVVAEHLNANTDPETIKIHDDILTFSRENEYDLAITRSLLHYFSKDDQVKVVRNIYHSLKRGGYFLLQAFIQNDSDLNLFLKLNNYVGKKLQLIPLEEVSAMLGATGFVEITVLGDAPTWNCSSDNLKTRYDLSVQDLANMARLISDAQETDKRGFSLNGNAFTVPVPFNVLIARKV